MNVIQLESLQFIQVSWIIELVYDAMLLGVIPSVNLAFENAVLSPLSYFVCSSQRFYLLRLLRDEGMAEKFKNCSLLPRYYSNLALFRCMRQIFECCSNGTIILWRF